jgi:spoIIIJ-associated protein
MRAVEAEGRTLDEAIDRALAALAAPRDGVRIDVLEGGAPGVFGIGRRNARVRGTLRSPLPTWRYAGAAALVADGARAPAPVARRSESPAQPGAGPAEGTAVRTGPPPPPAAAMLREIIRRLGFDGRVREEPGDGGTTLVVEGTAVEALVADRGVLLDALEYVVNRAQERPGGAGDPVTLDAAGHREARESSARELARKLAARARQRGRPVAVSPLPPHERQAFQAALRAEPGVHARVMGQGSQRRMMIVPEARRGGGKKSPR